MRSRVAVKRGLAAVVACVAFAAAGCGKPAADQHPSHTRKSTTTTTTTTTTTIPPVTTAADGKVTVLEVGDSLGEDLGYGMAWALSDDSKVTLLQKAVGYTGLANVGYYNWPAELKEELAVYHPQIVVVFLGGNDPQSFWEGSKYISFGSAAWRSAYGARVAEMMDEATSAGARVLWVGMPIMRPPYFSAEMATEDSVYRSEAASHPGVTYFSSWNLFATSSGQYNGGTTDIAGSVMDLRDPDGIHLDDGGSDLLGSAVVKELRQLYKLP